MGYRILLAEKSKESQGEIKKILENSGLPFDVSTEGKPDALIMNAYENRPDAIILNLTPAERNFELLQSLRSTRETRAIPLLVIVDASEKLNLEKIFEMGIIDLLFKPIDKIELPIRLKSIVSKNNYFLKFLKQAEKVEQLATIASKSSNSVAIISPDGKLEWVNNGFTEMYEYSFIEFKKKFEDSYFNPQVNTGFGKALQRCVSDKVNVLYENFWKSKSGDEKWIQTTLTPVFHEVTGQLINLIAIETDITELKKAESRLEEQNNYLLKVTKHLETTNEILEKQRIEIEKERQKADELLFNIFPYTVAKQLKTKGSTSLKTYKLVSVLFTDFKGFTKLSEQLPTEELIKELSNFFDAFDEITGKRYIEKIKTIGDSYMCAGGLPLSNKSNPIDVVLAGLEIQDFVTKHRQHYIDNGKPAWDLRLGIHSGEVIAGVIGRKKIAYDIWGDTVNTASRMETAGEIGRVNISGVTYQYIKDYFDCTYRGKIEVKYKGELEMYYVNRIFTEFAEDDKGLIPNEKFRKIIASY